MRFWLCAAYAAVIGVGSFFLGRLMARHSFDTEKFPFKQLKAEKGGFYEKIKLRKWMNLLPDMSRILPGLMPRKKMPEKPGVRALEIMVNETCVAEIIHELLALLGLGLLFIWPGWGGVLLCAIYIIVGNLPYILIQRYNRPRLLRLLRLARKREERELLKH